MSAESNVQPLSISRILTDEEVSAKFAPKRRLKSGKTPAAMVTQLDTRPAPLLNETKPLHTSLTSDADNFVGTESFTSLPVTETSAKNQVDLVPPTVQPKEEAKVVSSAESSTAQESAIEIPTLGQIREIFEAYFRQVNLTQDPTLLPGQFVLDFYAKLQGQTEESTDIASKEQNPLTQIAQEKKKGRQLPTLHRSDEAISIKWKPAYDKIIKLIARYSYLTSEQIHTLLGRGKSITSTQAETSQLFHGHYLNAPQTTRTYFSGSTSRIYHLDTKGKHAAHRQGISTEHLPNSTEVSTRRAEFFPKILDAHNAIISGIRLAREIDSLEVRDFYTVFDLKQKLNARREPTPDAFVTLATPKKYNLAWEIDRNTEGPTAFISRIAKYTGWNNQPDKHLDTTNLMVLFAVTEEGEGGETRAQRVVEWIEEELTRLKKVRSGSLFRVAHCDLTDAPQKLYYSPLWKVPFQERPVSILQRASVEADKKVIVSPQAEQAYQSLMPKDMMELTHAFLEFSDKTPHGMNIYEFFATEYFPKLLVQNPDRK